MNSLYLILDRYGSKPVGNLIGRGVPPTVPSANASFPVANLSDGRSDIVYMATSAGADGYIRQDTNIVVNGIVTGGTLGAAWIIASGTVAYQDIPMRAGEFAHLVSVMAGSSGPTTTTVQNLANGHYLNSSGVWQTASTVFATNSSSLATFEHDFTMGDISTCNDRPTPLVRITLTTTSGTPGAAYDNGGILLWPGVNFAAVYGHNCAGVVPILQSSLNGSSWTTQATLTVSQPGFYCSLAAPIIANYWRLFLSGTNTAIPFFGEVVIGQATSPVHAHRWDWHEKESWSQIRQKNDAGQTWAYTITDSRMRGLELQFTPYDTMANADTMPALESLRKDMWMRSKGGAYPIVLVPRTQRPGLIFGRIADGPLDVVQSLPNQQQLSIGIDPFPPPVVGP